MLLETALCLELTRKNGNESLTSVDMMHNIDGQQHGGHSQWGLSSCLKSEVTGARWARLQRCSSCVDSLRP